MAPNGKEEGKPSLTGAQNRSRRQTAAATEPRRCAWVGDDSLMQAYHDLRWCKPCHDDNELFAMLVLEGMQAGLSWSCIIKKEAALRRAFEGFDPERVAAFDQAKVEELLQDASIIRSRRKIEAAVSNAQAFLRVQREFGSFDAYLWGFTEGRTIDNHLASSADMPAQSPLSQQVSRDLKQRGFKFAGPVIAYSYLQAIGIVNDHETCCSFR